MDRQTRASLQQLDRRLQADYNNTARQVLRQNRAALERLADFDESLYLNYTEEQLAVERVAHYEREARRSGVLYAIAVAIALCGARSARAIQAEGANVFRGGYAESLRFVNNQLARGVSIPTATQAQLRILQSQAPQSPFTQVAYGRLGINSALAQQNIVNRLQNQVKTAIINGEGIDGVTQRIRNVTQASFNDARRIARTETGRLANQGRDAAWQQSNDLGIVTDKIWVHTGMSQEPREAHVAMNGQVFGSDGYFTLPNGEKARYPSDPKLSPGQAINCTCTFTVRVRSPQGVTQSYIENARRVLASDLAGGITR